MVPNRKKRNTVREWRVDVLFLAFIAVFLFVVFRLFQIQVLNHDNYRALAESQYNFQTEIPAERGSILSSDGFVLAGTKKNYLLFAEPQRIEDPTKTAEKIADIISNFRYKADSESTLEVNDIEKSDLDSEANGNEPITTSKEDLYTNIYNEVLGALSKDLMWVPVLRNITSEEKDLIENSGLSGLGFDEFPVRYYPEGTLAGHVLGFIGSDEKGERVGYSGIEGMLNDHLKGKPGKVFEETDALGNPILMGSYKKIPPSEGKDVVLTINRAIQYMVEKELKEGVEEYNALSGSVIVMEPMTGEIIAMANYPNYSPDNFNEKVVVDENTGRKNVEVRNLSISDTYEPGSVMKPLTVSAAVDLGVVGPTTTFVDSGPVKYSDYYIDNWDHKHHGVQTVVELLQKSNNIGAAWVGHQVGKENLYKYFSNFGIGARTGVDLQGEDTGILRPVKDLTDIDVANISFGQGVSATPLQVLTAFNAIANGGYLMQPKIIEKMIDENEVTEIPPRVIRRVLSQETSDTMVEMLEKAAEGGEAKVFILKEYRISGKTGTAEIPEGGKYAANRTNATFAGFLTDSKKFSLIVRLQEPKKSVYASETSVRIWMKIASELVKFYGVAPDNIKEIAAKSAVED